MTLAQTGNYSRWLTETQIRNGFKLNNPTTMGQISGFDEKGNPEFKGYFPITESDIGKTAIFINNWNGDWAENTKPFVPKNFTGGFIEKIEKDLKENPSQPSIWQEPVQIGIEAITEKNWQPLSSLVNRGLIVCLGFGVQPIMNWNGNSYVIQQGKIEQPENAFSLRFPFTSSPGDMAYLLATTIFGLANNFPEQTAFDNAMKGLGLTTFTEKMNYLLSSTCIGGVSQATWTNTMSQTQGINVFSQDVLTNVVYNGYCSTTPEGAGYASGDMMKITLNAIGTPINYPQTPFIAPVSTSNIGSNFAWTQTNWNDISVTSIPYDVWASNSAFLTAVQNGTLLLWNKQITVPSSNTIGDLVAQTTPYTGTNTGAFPVLPSASTSAATPTAITPTA